jgi:6-phosphofructokinase 1
VAKRLSEITSLSCTSCVLGHTQRGGSPVAPDRILGTRLGIHAVEAALDGATGVMIGDVNGTVTRTRFEDLARRRRVLDPAYWQKLNAILRT